MFDGKSLSLSEKSLFSVRKNFESDTDYETFKKQFEERFAKQ